MACSFFFGGGGGRVCWARGQQLCVKPIILDAWTLPRTLKCGWRNRKRQSGVASSGSGEGSVSGFLVNPSVCITERLLLSQQGLYLVEFVTIVGNTCIVWTVFSYASIFFLRFHPSSHTFVSKGMNPGDTPAIEVPKWRVSLIFVMGLTGGLKPYKKPAQAGGKEARQESHNILCSRRKMTAGPNIQTDRRHLKVSSYSADSTLGQSTLRERPCRNLVWVWVGPRSENCCGLDCARFSLRPHQLLLHL